MKPAFPISFARTAACVLAMTAALTASAQRASSPQDIILTNNPKKLAGISIGLAAVGAGVGLGVYFAVRHDGSLTGCAMKSADGLQLEIQGAGETYALVGEVDGIKAGERVRLAGRKEKPNPGVARLFLVSKVKKDYGACAAAAGGL